MQTLVAICLFVSFAALAATPPTPPADWMAQAQNELNQREYHVSRNEQGLQAPNRAQGFRTYFDEGGIRLLTRDAESAPIAGMRLTTVGRAGHNGDADHLKAQAAPISDRAQVVQRWPGGETRYLNSGVGLEIGLNLKQRPAGSGRLNLAWTISDATPEVSGNVVQLGQNTNALRLDAINAHDADGRALDLSVRAKDDQLQLSIDDRDARYPLTIKTQLLSKTLLSGVPDGLLQSNNINAQFGFSVAAAGDVNGDGFADVIVGAPTYDDGFIEGGAAFVYFGGSGTFNTVADARLDSLQPNAAFGLSVAGAGDVNGDGYADLIVGAKSHANGQVNEGVAFIFFGGSSFNLFPDAQLEANMAAAAFGSDVSSAGDVNGDGYGDVLVGAPNFTNGQANEGAAFVYFGGSGAFDLSADAQLEVNQANALLGASVAGAGDINGDGYADVVIGASAFTNGESKEGAAFVYFGGAGAFDTAIDAQLESNQIDAAFGESVAGAGDVNGDGFADLIVGAFLFDNGQANEGVAFVYFGASGVFNTTPDGLLEFNQADSRFGADVAGGSDLNGDGFADVMVGAYRYDSGQADEGAVGIYYGGTGAFDPSVDVILQSNRAAAYFGSSVAAVGDVNGDGYADLIAGEPAFDSGQTDEGGAFIYFGGAGAFNTAADAQLETNQANARLGWRVAGAGDVNGDAFADVIVGAPNYDNGQLDEGAAFVYFGGAGAFDTSADAQLESNQANARMGFSVAGAGDVNGDGFADVIAGAFFFDNGETDEGAAFIYFGGAGAFNTSADAQLESNQVNAALGESVAGAGDVNGDGFADVVVGARLFDNGQTDEGAAFMYFGGAGAFNTTADAQLESNQASAELGFSVASAGDVNGDGFADVIVGAYRFDNGQTDEGAAFIYLGGAGAFNTTADAQLEVNQASALMGLSVASAGDVNGDGFADVIVGAFLFDNGQADEGAAFVYFGGAGAFDTLSDALLESDQVSASIGYGVASAGDLNGDGFADVIVGAPAFDDGQANEGAAFVYFGGGGAFNTLPDAQLEVNQVNASMGFSVAGAGDLNGDGFADLIVGADRLSNGQAEEGAAFVYHGTANGRLVLAEQYRGQASTAVQPWGLSQRADGFVVALNATSAGGRERTRLQVEACPNGSAFGSPLCDTRTASTWTEIGANPQGVTVVLPITGLNPNRLFHWRARVQYAALNVTAPGITAPPKPNAGPWRRLQANGDVGDIRTGVSSDVIFANGFQ